MIYVHQVKYYEVADESSWYKQHLPTLNQ